MVVRPTHTTAEPPIIAGNGFTVTGRVIKQVVGSVYVTVALPDIIPVKRPEVATTVAVANGAILHVPPAEASVSVISEPAHTNDGPPIAAGKGLTVTGNIEGHPAPTA